jgi:hypothetical protein
MHAGGKYTGAALNPARVLGPAAVFRCGTDVAWIYILAQLFAALCACCIFAFVSGLGPLNPLTSQEKFGLTYKEAMYMWITGKHMEAYKEAMYMVRAWQYNPIGFQYVHVKVEKERALTSLIGPMMGINSPAAKQPASVHGSEFSID